MYKHVNILTYNNWGSAIACLTRFSIGRKDNVEQPKCRCVLGYKDERQKERRKHM